MSPTRLASVEPARPRNLKGEERKKKKKKKKKKKRMRKELEKVLVLFIVCIRTCGITEASVHKFS